MIASMTGPSARAAQQPRASKFEDLWDKAGVKSAGLMDFAQEAESLDHVYKRGFEDGQTASHAAVVSLVQEERRALEMEFSRTQEQQLMAAIHALCNSVTREFETVSAELRDVAARVLGSLVAKSVCETERRDLMRFVDQVMELRRAIRVTICGPENYLPFFADQLSARGLQVAVVSSTDPEISIVLDDVTLKSALPETISRLERALT